MLINNDLEQFRERARGMFDTDHVTDAQTAAAIIDLFAAHEFEDIRFYKRNGVPVAMSDVPHQSSDVEADSFPYIEPKQIAAMLKTDPVLEHETCKLALYFAENIYTRALPDAYSEIPDKAAYLLTVAGSDPFHKQDPFYEILDNAFYKLGQDRNDRKKLDEMKENIKQHIAQRSTSLRNELNLK